MGSCVNTIFGLKAEVVKTNRDKLIDRIAEETGEYKQDVRKFVEKYEEIIKQSLIDGEEVHLHGFITFCLKDYSKKESYVNPKTKEVSSLPAQRKIKVKVSDSLNRQFVGYTI